MTGTPTHRPDRGGTAHLSAHRWRTFFMLLGATVVALVAVTAWFTYQFSLSVPADCSACALAAVGLIPLYLLSAVALMILLGGAVIWLVARLRSRGGNEPGRNNA